MNILILTNHFNAGGISSYILNLSRGLTLRGHKVYVASSGGEWVERLKGHGVEHIYLPLRTKSIISPKLFLAYRSLCKLTKEKPVDIIHAQTRVTSCLAFWLSRKTSIPYLSTAHGFFRARLERRILPFWGRKVIAISEPVRQHLIRDFGLPEDSISLVHNGIDIAGANVVDPASRKATRNRFGLNDGPVIGIIARLSEVKGHRYLLKAMERVINEVPGAQLLSVGGGRLKSGLEALSRNLGIEKNVRFVDAVSDTREVISAIDIFVMPSLQEGLGLAIMEAMLLGVAVIASDIGGIPSLVRHNQTGILVRPADPLGLSLAIIALLKDKEKARGLIKSGRELIIKEFSLDRMVKATEGVYRGCLNITEESISADSVVAGISALFRPAPFFLKGARLLLTILGVLVLSFGLWLGIVLANYTPPILMYHYIDKSESQNSRLGVSPEAFERQMRFLRSHKYNIVSLDSLISLIREKKRIPRKTVAITFDDGYLNNYTYAFPILRKYNIPATFFVVIDRVGKRLGSDDYMSWQQIREISGSGITTIGSHSITHPNLPELTSDDRLRYEIFASKRILEKELGKRVELFSYPFGGLDGKARSLIIEAGYKGAVGTNFPRGYPGDDIYALKRLRISENCSNMFIFWVEISGFYTYIKEQRDSY